MALFDIVVEEFLAVDAANCFFSAKVSLAQAPQSADGFCV